MPSLELTNMVMIQDRQTGRVVVLDRVKSYCGISFPGGHIEDGESFVDSAIREAKEETGLDIRNLRSCGFMHWLNNKTLDRYLTFFYKTSDFAGELIDRTEEGRVFWATLGEVETMKLAPSFREYLPMFLEETHSEAFGFWNADDPWEIVYK